MVKCSLLGKLTIVNSNFKQTSSEEKTVSTNVQHKPEQARSVLRSHAIKASP